MSDILNMTIMLVLTLSPSTKQWCLRSKLWPLSGRYLPMPKRTTGLTDAHARLHKNHSYELLVCTWLMNGGWQVFMPMLDAAHAVDLIVSDGPHSYRLQIKSLESQDEKRSVENHWKGKHIDFVIYFAQRSNWGYVCPAFSTNQKRLNDPTHRRFLQNSKSFLAAFHNCECQPEKVVPLPPASAA